MGDMWMRLQNQRIKLWSKQPRSGDLPLRGEILSSDQLVARADVLARQHRTFTGTGSNRLLDRLDHNERVLADFNRDTQAVSADRPVTHAAEWLLDNYYLLEEQIQMTRRHLPPSYSKELPRLIGGSSAGFPRVYGIVLELISHVDAQIDVDHLTAFITSYQKIAPLKLGELWAVPIMLRLGLIENLQRVTTRLRTARRDRDLAIKWMERLQEVSETTPSHLVVILAEMARSDMALSSSFVAEFCQHLSRQNAVMHWVRNWLDQRLAEQGDSIEQLVHQESQMQAADQVSVSHSINSLRLLDGMNWKDFVEAVSQVEQTLRTDPSGVYGEMDFSTRDGYRHAVETIAYAAGRAETEVAETAVRLAAEGGGKLERGDRRAHVGYYLVDNGRPLLEKAVKTRFVGRTALTNGIRRAPMTFYGGGILLVTLLGTVGFFQFAKIEVSLGWLLFLTAMFALCLSQLAVSLINLLTSMVVTPRLMPRLNYATEIPTQDRTLVAIPTILARPDNVEQLLETLEIHFLANRDANLHFALLTDFSDAAEAHLAGDQALLDQAQAGIESLNEKYQSEQTGSFYLLHRPRLWNEREGRWMGYERKRGKLSALNALILEGTDAAFSRIVGDRLLLPTFRYVITLDTDTQLPRGAARKLVGTMAHPLNRPVFDPVKNIVTEGYGILQPRVGVSLPSAGRSWFARVFAGDAGIDPYTRAASDTYQDLFGEGTFIGKGIYDIAAFERASRGRFPENLVLSHDLIEACHARSALVSDVELYEAFPPQFATDASRRHRWIRGDWQIALWLLPRVTGSDGRGISNPISFLSHWKIADNLRRSLVPIAALGLLFGLCFCAPHFLIGGVLLISFLLLLPGAAAATVDVFRKPRELPWLMHLRELGGSFGRQLAQAALGLVFLPYDAFMSLDAIMRTMWRLLISHRRLLEWQTSSDAERAVRRERAGAYRTMWFAPAMGVTMAVYLGITAPILALETLPLWALWLAAPWLAWWLSQPTTSSTSALTETQHKFLRATARKTWRFFETFVTAQENWLPPDNFQEKPVPVIASRTSPTNIGLALLANLAARDFGYISVGEVIQRTRDTFATMQGLRKHRGHFFNWYDTRTMEPLRPIYVSSVDSGNLAGHLLTLGPGLEEYRVQGVYDPEIFAGLRDARESMSSSIDTAALDAALAETPGTLRAGFTRLRQVQELAAKAAATVKVESEDAWWLNALEVGSRKQADDLIHIAPWLALNQREWKSPNLAPEIAEALTDLGESPTLPQIAELDLTLCPLIEELLQEGRQVSPVREELAELLPLLHEASDRAGARLRELDLLVQQSAELANMDFGFLFDPKRELFTIGFNVDENRSDASFYDLLASEARLCSYVAIAQGQVPQDHWFSLGRLLLRARGRPVLVSWSGSLFEYLMPLLVMPNYENTLLDQTYKGAVERQIEYGDANGIPWGVSESGYNRTDVHLNYQYRAFGVPGLGLKRGLADDQVIAPYATVMALMVLPQRACENLLLLQKQEREGIYGFYEAVDYTPSRVPPGQTGVTICSYMAHHQGMSLLSLDYLLRDCPMQRRFLGNPLLKATDLLLHERVPKAEASILSTDRTGSEVRRRVGQNEETLRVIKNPSLAAPEVHLMSNGSYHVAISSAGGGYSRWRDLAVTRWREDATRDNWGSFVYLRDAESGEYWSNSLQPTLQATKNYEAIFTQARAEFRQRHIGIEVHTEITVSPEDDVELRRILLTNHSERTRVIELTSYAEVVIAPAAADAAHPAFVNLFVQTQFLPAQSALLCTRRARSLEDRPPWLFHLVISQGEIHGETSCETDRNRFIGRERNLVNPAAMQDLTPLSNTVGSVLDPIISLRKSVTIAPGESAQVDFIVGMSGRREEAVALVDKYSGARMADRTLDLAWTHSQVTLRQLNISEPEAQLYARLASSLIFASSIRRAAPSVLLGNRRGQSGLWSYSISGDLPIVLLRIGDREKIQLVHHLIKAHAYWRLKGLAIDLVILNDDDSVYRQSLYDEITGLISSGTDAQVMDKPGGIFLRNAEQVSSEDRVLLQAVARIVLLDENGSLAEQMEWAGRLESPVALLPVSPAPTYPTPELPWRDLILHNGLGGFTSDGREYVINLRVGENTPAPWVNVLANANFGTVVSESGSAYTWAENCHEFRLTPWTNDPVSNQAGEFFYVRDDQSGRFWSPTPSPARGATPYSIRHGFGYTVFEHIEDGIASELWIYVATDAPVKFAAMTIRNVSGVPRKVSVTGYWEWVLGDLREKNLLHVQTDLDPKSGALLARNPYNTEFPERVAFIDVNDPSRSYTGDRREFFGRNGTAANPAALRRLRLSGKVGAGLDPCAAVQVAFDLGPDEEHKVNFRIGLGRNAAEVQTLIQRFRRPGSVQTAREGVWDYWSRTLGAVQVETPEASVNIMANGWLVYQTLSCRLWARTGFYQSGGAFGFRDQLQDVMALVHAEPALVREHILRAATHQFREGDVQHWWHPPQGRGVRTHFSDDYLWLPYVTCRYVEALADFGVLDENVPFLEGRPVRPDEEAYYDLPHRAEEVATLYEHCVRAIKNGLKLGEHGLPLMGCGDWNDGMNMVGQEGKGESVWLAFFLYDVLVQFSALARQRQDEEFAAFCLENSRQLQKSIELKGWDGEWYRRAYFDDGTPLGSHANPECQIDALPQSWSVLSAAGDPSRARTAMASVERRLVKPEAGLIQLFDPPFDTSDLNPGYIKGYIPGVRENGGQYTHAAIWTTMAFAFLGETEKAWELFRMLNPIHHGETPEKIAKYKVEPYVAAADIYGVSPHIGRGGWTWYTGSAGWMYRLVIETLIGVQRKGDDLHLTPRVPQAWENFKVHYRFYNITYHLHFTRVPADVSPERTFLDGQELPNPKIIPLRDEGRDRVVEVQIW